MVKKTQPEDPENNYLHENVTGDRTVDIHNGLRTLASSKVPLLTTNKSKSALIKLLAMNLAIFCTKRKFKEITIYCTKIRDFLKTEFKVTFEKEITCAKPAREALKKVGGINFGSKNASSILVSFKKDGREFQVASDTPNTSYLKKRADLGFILFEKLSTSIQDKTCFVE